MTCKACLLDHSPLVGCIEAMRRRARMKVVAAVEKAEPNVPFTDSAGAWNGFLAIERKRHAHNAYQREYQRKRRAKLKEAV